MCKPVEEQITNGKDRKRVKAFGVIASRLVEAMLATMGKAGAANEEGLRRAGGRARCG